MATAGAYLSQSTLTVRQYLEAYERSWTVNSQRPVRLQEYQDRTLYTTWNLSFARLEADDPNAAQLLRLLAYFDNQKLWYELLQAGITVQSPIWLQKLVADRIRFESVVRALAEYCFIEVQTAAASFSMHNCVHDWTLAVLNEALEADYYWYAFSCVANSIGKENSWDYLGQLRYAPLVPHALCLTQDRFSKYEPVHEIEGNLLSKAADVGDMLFQHRHIKAAEQIYLRTLAMNGKTVGPEKLWILDTMRCLGNLYLEQGKPDEAEKMYLQGLAAGIEQSIEPESDPNLLTMENLGRLYRLQGNFDMADQTLQRVLSARMRANGPEHITTLEVLFDIGVVHQMRRKLDEAESVLLPLLPKFEATLGPDHYDTICLVDDIGILYCNQGRLSEAESMLQRAIEGYNNITGPQHSRTIRAKEVLAMLHSDMEIQANQRSEQKQELATSSPEATQQDKQGGALGKIFQNRFRSP